ncbi:MAG: sugar phosphate isomerase/epimerase family protein, partial [Pseudomonadales bacterium]
MVFASHFFGKSLSNGWGPFSEALKKNLRSVLQGEYDPLEFPRPARREFDISAIEYVNTFFFDRAQDQAYLSEMKNRAEAVGVTCLLIMCDAEANLGAADAEARQQAVQNHRKWLEAAAFLGCHSIRVNAAGDGSREDQQQQMAESLFQLAEYAQPYGLSVLVENHGGLSSDGAWFAGVMKAADHPHVGSLPDFGKFQISEQQS